ncbi:MAG: hypothetical protein DSY82_06325 [Flavobacteriia bacterium]|nr:MAG: hypothetical protein DSY82_06325 [Flavobacteriia bacterium]
MKEKEYFNKASEHLSIANEELYKPKEDVVSYLVCKNSQNAILNFLKGYLFKRGYETHEDETMQGLLDRCRSINPEFNKLNFKSVDCRLHTVDSSYCEEVSKVSACYKTADDLDTFFRNLHLF